MANVSQRSTTGASLLVERAGDTLNEEVLHLAAATVVVIFFIDTIPLRIEPMHCFTEDIVQCLSTLGGAALEERYLPEPIGRSDVCRFDDVDALRLLCRQWKHAVRYQRVAGDGEQWSV